MSTPQQRRKYRETRYKYYWSHLEEMREYNRISAVKFRKKHPGLNAQRVKEWVARHPRKAAEYRKRKSSEYYYHNREAILKRMKKYNRNRRNIV